MSMSFQLALMPNKQKSLHNQTEPRLPDPTGSRLLEDDSRYLAVQHLIEAGVWAPALPLLRTLRSEYPTATELGPLLAEAQLKTDVEQTWQGKIKGRSRYLPSPRLFKLLVMTLLLVGLMGGAWQFLGDARLANAVANEYVGLLEQAQSASQNHQYRAALGLYHQVLAIVPDNAPAQKGMKEVSFQLALADEYTLGVQALEQQQIQTALATLTALEEKAPNYRDTRQLLAKAQAAGEIEGRLASAEAAYQAQQWSTAVQEYEAVRQLDNSYRTELVIQQLAAAYLGAGQQIVGQRPATSNDLGLAKSHFHQALALQPALTVAQTEAELLAAYQTGGQALQGDNAAQAISVLEPLYQQRPAYLGGYLAEQLYAAYLLAGDQALAGKESPTALDYYTKAAALSVADRSEAVGRTQELSGVVVDSTVGSGLARQDPQVVLNSGINIRQGPGTNYPVIGGDKAGAHYLVTGKNSDGSWWQIDYSGQSGWVFGQLVTPQNTEAVSIAQEIPLPPPPTATPANTVANTGLAPFHGWIAFRSNRDGDTTIYLMQADGSQPQRAPIEVTGQLDELYRQQQWTSNGPAQLSVASPPGRTDGNIYLVRTGQPDPATSYQMLTDYNGTEYDPTWSPNGAIIAFVANHTGNDELWTLDVPSGTARQLTHNEWEWDKHPTWSPDGGQIAFFSNRTGARQIWVMSADGSNQHNISNHQFEDWDPVWLR